ncbi:hypothetical protein [Streptomyces sp. CA2R101]
MDLDDAFCPWNTGRYRLQADEPGVTRERTERLLRQGEPVRALSGSDELR